VNERLLRAAYWYARRGWSCFPVAGKAPLTAHGFQDATSSRFELERLFADRRATGVAIACGASRLLVVDLDGQEGLDAWADLAARNGGHEPTLVVATPSGGRHLYFAGEGRSTTRRLGPGIDTKGAGGYVVAPPSRHPAGGEYRFRDPRAPLAPAPAWLLEALVEPAPVVELGERRRLPAGERATSYGRVALEGLCDGVLAAIEGSRNDTLLRAAIRAGRLEAAGELDAEAAERVLVEAACHTGLAWHEALSTFRNGLEFGRQYPAARAAR
jgi:hypothetical protein